MNKKLLVSLLTLSLLLFSCDALLEVQIKISSLLASKNQKHSGELYVVVSACGDMEDSRQPSKSLLEIQKNVPRVFSNAKYIECFSKNFNSFAHFTIPITVNQTQGSGANSYQEIDISSNDTEFLTIHIPESINQQLEQIKEESYGASSLSLTVNLNLVNDTQKEYNVNIISSYIDNEPVVNGNIKIPTGSSFWLRLSNVAVDNALQYGSSPVALFQKGNDSK